MHKFDCAFFVIINKLEGGKCVIMTLICFIGHVLILFFEYTELLSKSDWVLYQMEFNGNCGFVYFWAKKIISRFKRNKPFNHITNVKNEKEVRKKIFDIRDTFFRYIMWHICFGFFCIILSYLLNLLNQNHIEFADLNDSINTIITITLGILTVSAVSVSFILRSTERQQDNLALFFKNDSLLDKIKEILKETCVNVYGDSISLKLPNCFAINYNGVASYGFGDITENAYIATLDSPQTLCFTFVSDDISEKHLILCFRPPLSTQDTDEIIFQFGENIEKMKNTIENSDYCLLELRMPLFLDNKITGARCQKNCLFSFKTNVYNNVINVLNLIINIQ